MRAKYILAIGLVLGTMFSEGCSLQDAMSRVAVNGQPLGPSAPQTGFSGDPLSGSLAGGLPLGPTSASPLAPGATIPGAVPAAVPGSIAAVPTAPTATAGVTGITPPTPVSTGNTGSAPQATPIGTGPILPNYTNAQLSGISGAINPLSSTPSAGVIGL